MMKDLKIGDEILTVENGVRLPTTVLGFLDKRISSVPDYLNIRLDDGKRLSISSSHVMFVLENGNKLQDVFAKNIKLGDMVYVLQDGKANGTQVVDIINVKRTGAYVPLTATGTLIVDGVLVSSYTNAGHWQAHTVLAPLRWFPNILLDTEKSQEDEGVRTIPRIAKKVGSILGLITTTKREQEDHRPMLVENMGLRAVDSEKTCLA